MSNSPEVKEPKRPRIKKPKRHPMLNWIIKAGIGSECFGWGALLLAGWFWPAAILIYAGFALFAIDAWCEPELKDKTFWRVVILLVICSFAATFSYGIVFVKAPLGVSALMTDATYPAGTQISGIAWRPEFTEVQVWINNDTDKNYDDLNLVLRPVSAIASIGQASTLPGISFEEKNHESVRLMAGQINQMSAIPLALLATDGGYRVRCQHLPSHSTLEITLALADIKWNPKPLGTNPAPFQDRVREKDYMLRVKDDDFSTYWFGHPDGDIYAPRPTSSETMKVEGEYFVAQRTRKISQKISIGGKFSVKQP